MQWEGVSKRYPGADALALDDVSFSVGPGEIVVLVGPNGSGKTTAMEMVSGLRPPTSGEVRVAGRCVRPSGAQRMVIGVQLQEAGLPQRLKVREAVSAAACLYDDPGPVAEIVSQLGLDAYMSTPVGSLSGGWARRLDVLLACIGRPCALVLDEPTSGIDPVARAELWEFLRRRRHEGVAVLASTHDLSEAEAYADRLLVLNRGRLVLRGPVEEVLGLAGGRWRLRLIGVGPAVDAWARRHGVGLIGTGDTRVLVGSKDEVVRVGEQVEAARERGERVAVARTHGDLWTGNVMWVPGGTIDWAPPRAGRGPSRPAARPVEDGPETDIPGGRGRGDVVGVLIDPLAQGAHAETDLAALSVFGQRHLDRIYAGYDEVSPLAAGWRERVGLHQLHMLIIHAFLFGASYGAETASVARRYA